MYLILFCEIKYKKTRVKDRLIMTTSLIYNLCSVFLFSIISDSIHKFSRIVLINSNHKGFIFILEKQNLFNTFP